MPALFKTINLYSLVLVQSIICLCLTIIKPVVYNASFASTRGVWWKSTLRTAATMQGYHLKYKKSLLKLLIIKLKIGKII